MIMQRFAYLLAFCILSFWASGQKAVTQGEYFWDTDPGQGNGIALIATDGAFDEVVEDLFQNGISVASLSTGAHSFNVRIKGQDGTWSNSFKQTIYVQGALTTITRTFKVTQGEYFWDADPGQGNGTPLLALDGNFDEVLEDLFQNGISILALSQGAHNFSVRIKGQDGGWSDAFKQTIWLEGPLTVITRTFKITQGEYFWDADPGQGNGAPLLALDGNFDKVIEDLFQNGISILALSQGAHNFSVRIKGQDGGWSDAFKQTIWLEGPLTVITRTFKVTQGEYFWDGDPGQGNGTPLLALDGNFDKVIEDLFQNGISISALSQGAHNFSVRIKGQDGGWSDAFKQTIYLEGPLTLLTRTFKVTQGEYFWDADPGQGNGTPLLAVDGAFDEVLEDLFRNGIDVSALSQGAHNFSVRIKGQEGNWSNAFKQTIYLEGPLTLISRNFRITQGEYFWDADPGQGNGTPLLAADGTFNTVLENLVRNNIDVSPLSLGAHNFSVRVKGFDGGWSPVFKQTIYIECSTPTAPSISIAVTGNGACQGTTVQFTAAAINGGNSPIYLWKVNGTPSGSNSPFFGTSALVNGDVVTCELTSNSGCASPLNAISNSIAVTLTPAVVPTISVTASPGNNVCSATSVTFTAATTNGGASPSYQWKVNGVGVGVNNPSFTSTTLLNGDVVNCEFTSNATCAIPATVISAAITMSVVNIATPGISISSAATTICAGTNITFTATASNGGGSPVYQWKINGSNVGTNSTVFSSATLNNGDVVSCEVTSSLTCVTTPSAVSNGITMTVNPNVSASVSISSSAGSTICSGTSVTFTAAPVNGGSPTYQWLVNGSPAGTNSPTFVTTALTNGEIVTCQMTSSLNCASPVIAGSNSITMIVNNSATPTASISSSQGSSICDGTNVTFTASVTNGGSSPVYQWMLNGSPVGTNSPTYSNAALTNGTTISCVVTSNSPCVNGVAATSNTITMNVSNIVTPTISIASSATTICAGTNVIFTATPANGGGAPAYQWKTNGINAGTNSSTFSPATLNNGDIVTCELTSSLNCVTTSSATSNGITMIVNPTVSTAVSISSSAGSTICEGTSVTFTATPTNGGTPVYQWLLNGAPAGTNSSAFVSSALTGGDLVSCQMTSSLTCPVPAIANSNTITMTVNSTAAPTASISSNQGNNICSGTAVLFTASVTNGGASPVYQWMLNGSPVGTNSLTYSNAALTNSDVISFTLTSNSPCVNGVVAASNSITMTVTPTVVTDVSISASATTICSGTAVTFTATPVNGGTPVYQWLINGSNAGTNSNTFTSSTLANGSVVSCQMTSSIACATPAAALSNTITMTVSSSASPTVSITSNPAGSTICSGTAMTFTANISNGGPAPVYQWKLNGANVGTNTSTYVNSTLATGDAVTCELTSNAPCATVQTVLSNSITKTVNQSVTPTVTITSNPAMPVCDHQSVTFTATITNGGSNPDYQWKKNGQNYGLDASTYSTSLWSDGDVFTCVLTSNAACATSNQVTSNGITTDIITIDASTTVSGNTITANQPGAVYQWYDCVFQQAIPGATQQSYTASESGLYGVEITMGSCTEESDCEMIEWNALDELSAGGMLLYPNPATDYFTLELPYSARMNMTLYDVAGRKVMEDVLEGMQHQIDVHVLATGSYRIVLSDGNRDYVGKIMVNR